MLGAASNRRVAASAVRGRARTCLLVETMGAVERIEAILAVPGIDFIHIGLNDIHIERGTRFMFEPYADGLLDGLAGKIRGSGIPFGIGGMARIGEKIPPAEAIIAQAPTRARAMWTKMRLPQTRPKFRASSVRYRSPSKDVWMSSMYGGVLIAVN